MSQVPGDSIKLQGQRERDVGIPEGLWMRCPECSDMLFRKVVEEAMHVCPNCQYHFRIGARARIARNAGVDWFVVASAIFDQKDRAAAIRAIRQQMAG